MLPMGADCGRHLLMTELRVMSVNQLVGSGGCSLGVDEWWQFTFFCKWWCRSASPLSRMILRSKYTLDGTAWGAQDMTREMIEKQSCGDSHPVMVASNGGKYYQSQVTYVES